MWGEHPVEAATFTHGNENLRQNRKGLDFHTSLEKRRGLLQLRRERIGRALPKRFEVRSTRGTGVGGENNRQSVIRGASRRRVCLKKGALHPLEMGREANTARCQGKERVATSL